MKKSFKLILFTLLLSVTILWGSEVSAYSISWNSTISGQSPEIRRYMTNIDGGSYMTYCLDPGRQFNGNGKNFTILRNIDIRSSAPGTPAYRFDIAATYVYQKMLANGYAGTADAGRIVGTTAFRIITFELDNGGITGPASLKKTYNAYANYGAGVTKNEYVNVGIQYAREAIAFAVEHGNTPYEELVKNSAFTSTVWAPNFESVGYTLMAMDSTSMKIRFAVRPTQDVSSPEKFKEYVEAFKGGCTNESVSCTVNNKVTDAKLEPAGVIIEMTIDTSKWDKKDLGIYVDAAYCDPKAASYQLALLQNPISSNQRMIVVLSGGCPSTPTPRTPTPRIHVYPSETCVCNYDSKNVWDGTYTINKFKDGTLTQSFTIKDGPEVSKYSCPSVEECKKKANSCERKDNKFYCTDGNECSQEQWDKECNKHSCQTPEESGDGNYYCEESSPGAGDGKICTKEEYNTQCKKINCSPTVSIPGTCADFDTGVGSSFDATISDINLKAGSCNPDANQVKQCVLGKEDATKTSYESTVDGLQGNKYCKVWCKENYTFDLPNARLTTSGEYFTLTTSIKGNRDCYISSATDASKGIAINSDGTNQYKIDIANIQVTLMKAWDDYNYNKIGYNTAPTITTSAACNNTEDQPNGNGGIDACGKVKEQCSEVKIYTLAFSAFQYNASANNESVNTSTGNKSYSETFGEPNQCGCNTGKCGKSGEQDYEAQKAAFKKGMDDARERIIRAVNEMNRIISEYNSCSGAIQNTNQSNVGSTNPTSSGWANDMKFDPIVTFNYNENYIEKKEGNFNPISGSKKDTNEEAYCTGEVTDEYECTNGFKTTSASNKVETASAKSYWICGDGEFGCKQVNYTVSDAKWIRKSREIFEEYEPNRKFSTYSPYGTVKVGQDGVSTLYTNLPDYAFPISLLTKTGTFPFKFTFKNIGQSNQNGSLGRLIGNNTSVLTAFNQLKVTDKCTGTEEDKVSPDDVTNTVDGGYVCHYINNCPDCTGKCEPDESCEICLPNDPSCNDPCTDNCIGYCRNCIFGGTSSGYTFRPVSLTNLQPNERENDYQGWNWNNEYKGQITKREIEADGESIYEAPQFSVELTIDDLAKLREYNKKAESFVNATLPEGMSNSNGEENALYCEKITINGMEYNVKCRSTFLDYMEEHKGEYGTILERVTRDVDGFELFIDDSVENITGCGSSSGYACLANKGIGPSWRVRKTGGNS